MKPMSSFNKLVRDKIPEIISANGSKPVTRVLDVDEYAVELERKDREEHREFLEAETREEKLEELADRMEILRAQAELLGYTPDELEAVRAEKAQARGGFAMRIYLERVEDD